VIVFSLVSFVVDIFSLLIVHLFANWVTLFFYVGEGRYRTSMHLGGPMVVVFLPALGVPFLFCLFVCLFS